MAAASEESFLKINFCIRQEVWQETVICAFICKEIVHPKLIADNYSSSFCCKPILLSSVVHEGNVIQQ